jgi:hypothetical protein
VNPDGSYNGARNIFFLGYHTPGKGLGFSLFKDDTSVGFAQECACSSSDLTHAPDEVQWKD